MKLLADVGIIGVPNAGKSSLITFLTAARPKIANYPFTTIDPVLGIVEHRDKDFVMVDIPGLIEGAHKGVGLGHEFLRHIERTKVLIHLVDGTSEDPSGDFRKINRELEMFNEALIGKPQILAINKVDLDSTKNKKYVLTIFLIHLVINCILVIGITLDLQIHMLDTLR